MRTLIAVAALAFAAPALADKTDGIVPGILIGPKLGIVNFPTPTIGVEAKIGRWFGVSFDYGLVPDITISNVTVNWNNWYIGGRVFPFQGSFFLGALYGHRSFSGSAVDTGTGLKGTADASSDYLAPEIGWRWIWDSGLFMGIDLGWQFVTSNSKTVVIPGGFDPQKQKDINDATDKLGTAGLPVLGLLQIGFFF